MINTRLIIIEGIMGSGKSTMTVFLAQQLRKNKIKQKRVMEASTHPTNVLLTLPDWKKPWLAVSVEEYMQLCERSWRRFIGEALPDKTTYVFDGQFLHGDFTSLMMMNASQQALTAFTRRIVDIMQPLSPVLIYLYQNPVDQALERIANERGKGWVKYQVGWKTETPYCQDRGYAGKSGWIQLYREYRLLTDGIVESLTLPRLSIDISGQDWPEYRARALDFLGLPPVK